MKSKNDDYCCMRLFLAAEDEQCIVRSSDEIDETEWYIKECMHIYFCPFCGSNIKGKGTGGYDIKEQRMKFDEIVMKRYKNNFDRDDSN